MKTFVRAMMRHRVKLQNGQLDKFLEDSRMKTKVASLAAGGNALKLFCSLEENLLKKTDKK